MSIATVAASATMGSPLLGLALLVACATLVALGLRRLRVPASPLVGGTLAGVMLGSAFLGRIAPDTYLNLYEGPPEMLHQSIASERAIGALAFAAGASQAKVDPNDLERLGAERDQDRAAWESARGEHRGPFVAAALALAGIVMATAFTRGARPVRPGGPDVAIALWSFAIPAVCVAVLARWRGDDVLAPSTALVAAACGCGAWWVSGAECATGRGGARDAARRAATSASLATALACALAAAAFVRGLEPTRATIPALALCGGAALSSLVRGRVLRWWRAIGRRLAAVAVPSLAAIVAIGIDPLRDLSPMVFVLLFLVAEDGRWLGAFAARVLGGEPAGVSVRSAMVGLSAGPTMLAFVGAGAATRVLSPASAAGLLLAAALLEFLRPARLRLARRLEDAQAETEDAERR
ncbi:MAG: hypothetical protein U0572_06610 [Phycisphaerales bacterium]